MCQWYSSRNVLGSENLSPIQEWEQFAKCLLKQCGYHIDTLNVFEFSARYTGSGSSPDAASKKVRPNESGSDDDWTYLLSSSRHRETSTQISYLLGLKPVSLGAPDSSRFEIEPVSVDRTSALFSHLYSVTWSLHLLYEEIKLNKVCPNSTQIFYYLGLGFDGLPSCHHSCLQLRRYVFEFWYREKTFIDEVAEIMKSVSLNKNYYFVQITTQRQSCLTKVPRTIPSTCTKNRLLILPLMLGRCLGLIDWLSFFALVGDVTSVVNKDGGQDQGAVYFFRCLRTIL